MLRSEYGTHVLKPAAARRDGGGGRFLVANALALAGLAWFAWTGGLWTGSRGVPAALSTSQGWRAADGGLLGPLSRAWAASAPVLTEESVTVTAVELARRFPLIGEALADMGAYGCDAAAMTAADYKTCLEQYLPEELVFTWNPEKLGGSLGRAAGGWMFTCFNQYTLDTSTSSLLVVFNASGYIRAATIMPSSLPYDSDGLEVDDLSRVTVDGMRLFTPDVMLLLSNSGRIKAGTPYLWEWRTEVAPYVIQNPDTDIIIDSHASSLSYDAPLGTNKFYALFDLNPNSTGLARYDTVSGKEDEVRHDVYLSPDYPNHIQYLDGDAFVLTGNKEASPEVCSFFLMDQDSQDVIWCVGGANSDFAMFDIDGSPVGAARNYSFWNVNHGLEYFGDGEYMVFANSRNATDLRSRVAIVDLNFDTMVARVVWDFPLPYTFVYGDADRVPTGNVLTNHWPTVMTDTITYEASVLEVTRPADAAEPLVAFDLKVYGSTGNASRYGADPAAEQVVGWAAYAVEKFFDEPLVGRVDCTGTRLSFETWDLFKMNNPYAADYAVLDADGAALQSGSFTMKAMWRTSSVSVDLADPRNAASVVVRSVWGTMSAPTAFKCR